MAKLAIPIVNEELDILETLWHRLLSECLVADLCSDPVQNCRSPLAGVH
ncbi:MAG: hypothetical protein QGH25_19255 [Candidatus Latescibacteria bacterium]|nr:hypothetical protein [Candidatus Latescibacterota bacterium]